MTRKPAILTAYQYNSFLFSHPFFVCTTRCAQEHAQFARGKLERTLGESGDVEAETEGLLIENNVDTREFSTAALSSLPISEAVEWTIDEKVCRF